MIGHKEAANLSVIHRTFRTLWHMVARLPPYMEVLSASDPAHPHLATFLSHGLVVCVRNPAMVMRALMHSGIEVIPMTSFGAPEGSRMTPIIIAETLPQQQHVLRIGLSQKVSPAAWKRVLLLLWSLPASDVASPYFHPWTHSDFMQWTTHHENHHTAATTTTTTTLTAAGQTAAMRHAASTNTNVVSTAKTKKKDPRSGAMPQLYQHPNVVKMILQSTSDVEAGQCGDRIALEHLAVTCAEPTSPLAVLLFGPVALGLAKL
jgi:hypothetical protein